MWTDGIDALLADESWSASGDMSLCCAGLSVDHMWTAEIQDLFDAARRSRRSARQIGPVPRGRQDHHGPVRRRSGRLVGRAWRFGNRVVFCGLSMGGYIAFQFWRKYAAPLRGLILCDTRATADTPEGVEGRRRMAERVLREGPAPLVETMLPKLLAETTRGGSPKLVERLRSMIMAGDPRASPRPPAAWPNGPT